MRENHCAKCGYLVEYHDVARRCPGMKTGVWTERDPIDGALWPEILARDVAARMRTIEVNARVSTPVVVEPPMIVARAPRGPQEFAGGQGRQALGLGRLAASLGFQVAPYYWKSGAGVDGCAVKGYRTSLAFVATWERKAGDRWKVDVAYAWVPRHGRPVRMPVTQLESIIRGG